MQRIVSTFNSPRITNIFDRNLKIHKTSAKLKCLQNFFNFLRHNSTDIRCDLNETQNDDKGFLTKETAFEQLNDCGKLSLSKNLDARIRRQEQLWEKITKQKEILTVELCNTYLQVCIENETSIDHHSFLKSLPCKPNHQTFILLLKSASERGNINGAIDILTKMKENGFPANEQVFNALILGYTIEQGLEGANYVLGTMKIAQVAVTVRTNWQILKGLVRHGNKDEFRQFLNIIPTPSQHDQEYRELILTMGLNYRHSWLQCVIKDYRPEDCDRTFLSEIYNICAHLVQRNRSDAAINFYLTFLEPVSEKSYGQDLLNEMLTSRNSLDECLQATEQLKAKNPYAMYNLAFLVMERGLIEDAYKVFEHLDELRPHYFWPLLVNEARNVGEPGIFRVLEKMAAVFKVKPDFDTLNWYVLPYMKVDNYMEVLQKLANKDLNLTRRDVLTPLSIHLLLNNKCVETIQLCETCKLPIQADKILKPLAIVWYKTKNAERVGRILQLICENNNVNIDWTGLFIEKCLKQCKREPDMIKLLQLLKNIDQKLLRITSSHCDNLLQILKNSSADLGPYKTDVEGAIERLLDITKLDDSLYVHPRDMNIDEMECHLLELQEKNMETRGLLRRLILNHANMGNFERVTELRKIFQSKDYEETAGMKSTLFHALSLAGDLKGARTVFEELKHTHPNFKIDTFKIIDFTTLLVRHDLVNEAFFVLNRESKPTKLSHGMIKNCWNLLGACKKPEDSFKLFQTLVEKNYCKPTNVILGPILRPYITQGNMEKLVHMFCYCVQQYRATPLQLEVLCEVIDSKNEELLQTVLDAITLVHGTHGAKMGLLSALAEKGLQKPILKLLQEKSQMDLNDLKKRCQRWVNEDKLLPLRTLDAANKRLSHHAFDHTVTSDAIVKVFCNRNDCEGALAYWQELEDNDLYLSAESIDELLNTLKIAKMEIPKRLLPMN